MKKTTAISLLLVFPIACSPEEGPVPGAPNPLQVVLTGQPGDTELDQRIARQQAEVRRTENPVPHLEQLGTLYVVKARVSSDPGYYKLAELCAESIDRREPGHEGALLLRGHVLHSLHRFGEAKEVAQKLVDQRGLFIDYGLLGDVQLDQGRLEEALDSYQRMLDIKPCLQSYTRAARVRWMRGDLEGAQQLLVLAQGSGSPRDPEPLAWTYSRLALLELQQGHVEDARRRCQAALQLTPEHAKALFVMGLIHVAAGEQQEALDCLRRASDRGPLPEYGWALADLLRSLSREAEAQEVETALERTGARDDPRTFAVYLATRGRSLDRALELVAGELDERQDVFTHDAHAWALLAAGNMNAADQAMQKALVHGTVEARLFYHAGAIAVANGRANEARQFFERAERMGGTLLPSELADLRSRRAAL